MVIKHDSNAAGGEDLRRLFVYNGGFLTQTRVRRILELSGWSVSLGKPGPADWVGVWGKSPTAPRGEAVAGRTSAPILRVEDAFLRSVLPGRAHPPIGLSLDKTGVHFDSSAPSDLETLLANHPLDDNTLLRRARAAIDRIQRAHLSKFNAFDPAASLPEAPYVLVIDQTLGDASIRHGGAGAATFHEMLVFAQTEHPGLPVVIKSHPETAAGRRAGHFGPQDASARVTLLSDPVSPRALMQGAVGVYTVSSLLGFEAIFAGHKPRVFGQPFYCGWGLSADENPPARRQRKLSRTQLFAAAIILYPTWYDPFRDRLCALEDAIGALEAEARAWREDLSGYVAFGMARWKHRFLQDFYGGGAAVKFESAADKAVDKARQSGRNLLVWAKRGAELTAPQVKLLRIEDGFLRSRGLGARLVPPLSLVRDDLGIYYDPGHESRLERMIAASCGLSEYALERAERLVARICERGLSKYNTAGAALPELPAGHRILVTGQVEDDASVLLGCGTLRSNLALLQRCRADNPDAVILYKPHPDVEAGLRQGDVKAKLALQHADMILQNADPIALIDVADEVWTLTSLLGFEALLRGK
ncbi:MAG: capsular polysaccharide biosynthesis protein, partial [Paracoccaceae bacterium]